MRKKLQIDAPVFNNTMRKFGAPSSVIFQSKHWSILLRPMQVTLGSLVLVAHDPVSSFSDLNKTSFTELHKVTKK